jgi:hypothetical protein
MENDNTRLYAPALSTVLFGLCLAVALWRHLPGNIVAVFGICLGVSLASFVWRYRTR